MMPTWPSQKTRSPRRKPAPSGTSIARAGFGLLHVRIARQRMAGGCGGKLHQAGAVQTDAGASAPKIGRAEKALSNGDEIRRVPADGREMASIDEPAESSRA